MQPALTHLSSLTYDVVRAQLTALRQHEAGTRSGDDPEDLHDMRVATRRLRAALRTFDQVLPPEAQLLYEELRWLGGGLAAVRDLDVQIERVEGLTALDSPDDREALDALRATLQSERESARTELHALLDSERYRAILTLGADLLTRPVPERAEVTVGGAACALVERPYGRFRKMARRLTVDSPPTEFHASCDVWWRCRTCSATTRTPRLPSGNCARWPSTPSCRAARCLRSVNWPSGMRMRRRGSAASSTRPTNR
jgi:CHAD domain-containing protein